VSTLPQQQAARGAPRLATVAVIIPCFNDGETLPEAVESARLQERLDELIVVDDGSTDPGTIEAFATLEREGITVVHRQNGGLGAARMSGVRATGADYVLCLDADDRLLPGALATLAAVLDGRPEIALVWGDYRLFGDYSWRQQTAPCLDAWQLSYQNDIPACLLVRREALLETGGWELRGGYEDWDMLMGMAERGKRGARAPVVAYEYRRHGSRMLGESAGRHGQIYALLRSRHPDLFAHRMRLWRRSRAPLALRIALPLIFCLPIGATRRRLVAGAACHLAHRRGVGLLLRRIRAGY
jgi:glycosyltransferase involved in cell wall biosynthesis